MVIKTTRKVICDKCKSRADKNYTSLKVYFRDEDLHLCEKCFGSFFDFLPPKPKDVFDEATEEDF